MRFNPVIGIDPGSITGWAVVRGGLSPALKAYGQVELDYDTTATGVLRKVAKMAGNGRVIVAIEDQYLPRTYTNKSTVNLCHAAGRWEEAAAALGHTPTWVNPKSWQSAELGRLPKGKTKKASIQKVKGLYGCSVNEHIADAILIARWCAIAIVQGADALALK